MVFQVLVNAEGSIEVNDRVHQFFDPLIDVEKVTWVGKVACEGVLPPAGPLFKSIENLPPRVPNHIDNITARVGELLVYPIPLVSINYIHIIGLLISYVILSEYLFFVF